MITKQILIDKGYVENNSYRIKILSKVFNNCQTFDIYDAYINPSEKKKEAYYNTIQKLFDEFGYIKTKVITHTISYFTIGFILELVEGSAFIYISKTHKYFTMIYNNII